MTMLPEKQQAAFDAFMQSAMVAEAMEYFFRRDALKSLAHSLALAAFVAGEKYATERCEREHHKP